MKWLFTAFIISLLVFTAKTIEGFKKAKKWIPEMKNEKAVRFKHAVPINFTLSS